MLPFIVRLRATNAHAVIGTRGVCPGIAVWHMGKGSGGLHIQATSSKVCILKPRPGDYGPQWDALSFEQEPRDLRRDVSVDRGSADTY